jgi:putative oxidoreductase
MLNPFPDLLTYGLLAPFILRVVAGFIFLNLGILAFKNEKERWIASLSVLNIPSPKIAVKIFGGIEIVGGIMLVLGFYTQVAALILAFLTFAEVYVEYKDPLILKRNFVFYIMLLAILISLILSGAGAFAFDLPL